MNGLIFALIGLQLGSIMERLSESRLSLAELVLYAALISFAVILARFLLGLPATYGPRWLSRHIRQRTIHPRP